jgi:hypothetical protein
VKIILLFCVAEKKNGTKTPTPTLQSTASHSILSIPFDSTFRRVQNRNNLLRFYSSERREPELLSSLDTIDEGMRIITLPDVYSGKDIHQTFNILPPTISLANNINLPTIYITSDVIHDTQTGNNYPMSMLASFPCFRGGFLHLMNNCSFSPFRGKRKTDNNDIIRYRIKSIKLRLLDLNGSAPNLLKFKMKIL